MKKFAERFKVYFKAHWKWIVPLAIGVAATAYFALRKSGKMTGLRLAPVGGGGGGGGGDTGSTQGAGTNLGPGARPLVAPPLGLGASGSAVDPISMLPLVKSLQPIVGTAAPRPTAPAIPNLTAVAAQSVPTPVSFSQPAFPSSVLFHPSPAGNRPAQGTPLPSQPAFPGSVPSHPSPAGNRPAQGGLINGIIAAGPLAGVTQQGPASHGGTATTPVPAPAPSTTPATRPPVPSGVRPGKPS